MSIHTPVLNRVKQIVNALNPSTRGDLLELTKEVKAELKDLQPKLEAECRKALGMDVPEVKGKPVPDSASADYAWAKAQVADVLKSGDAAAADTVADAQPVIPAVVASNADLAAQAEPAPVDAQSGAAAAPSN